MGGANELVGTLAHGASHTATFEFTLASNTPDNYQALVYTTVTSGEFKDGPDLLRFSVNEVNVATHNTGALVASITNEGNMSDTSNCRRDSNVPTVFGFAIATGNNGICFLKGACYWVRGRKTYRTACARVDTGPDTRQHRDLILKPGIEPAVIHSPGS